jgi:hypothetical protein
MGNHRSFSWLLGLTFSWPPATIPPIEKGPIRALDVQRSPIVDTYRRQANSMPD